MMFGSTKTLEWKLPVKNNKISKRVIIVLKIGSEERAVPYPTNKM
jgi:hypothetical protein